MLGKQLMIFSLMTVSLLAHSQIGYRHLKPDISWEEHGFHNANLIDITVDDSLFDNTDYEYTHSLNLSLIVDQNSQWTEKLVREEFKKTLYIYAQCGIQIKSAKYISIKMPFQNYDFLAKYTGKGSTKLNTTRALQSISKLPSHIDKPIIFFAETLDQSLNVLAFREKTHTNNKTRDLINTAYVSTNLLKSFETDIININYSSMAHELGHLLDYIRHTKSGQINLMSNDIRFKSDVLTEDQCLLFKKSKLLTPL